MKLCVEYLWFGEQLATHKEKQCPALCSRICNAVVCNTMDLCLHQTIMKTKIYAYDKKVDLENTRRSNTNI